MLENLKAYKLLVILLTTISAFGQDLNQRYYNGPLWQDFRNVEPYSDSTFLIVTQSWDNITLYDFQTQIAVIHEDGRLLTESTIVKNIINNYMGIAGLTIQDSSIIISGSILGHNMTTKIKDGNIVWSKNIDIADLNNTLNTYFEEIAEDTFVIAGRRFQFDYGFAAKINSDGLMDSIVKVNASDTLSNVVSFEMFPTNEGGYYLVSNEWRYDNQFTFQERYFNIVKVDANLDVIWNNSYSAGSIEGISEIFDIVEHTNGFVAVGRHGENLLLTKLSPDGTVFWTKEYQLDDGSASIFGSSILNTTDGAGFIIATGVPSPAASTNYRSLLVVTDSLGNLANARVYNPDSKASFSGIQWHDQELIGYGRVVSNTADVAFWLRTEIGNEDCQFLDVTDRMTTFDTTIVDNPLKTIIVKLRSYQSSNVFLSADSDASPQDSLCTYSKDVVYPGDANFNQVANVYDLLPIGVFYEETGEVRPNASLDWIGQYSADWEASQIEGSDIKHIDCDGDGVIGSTDVDAIVQNYGLTHMGTERRAEDLSRLEGPELFVDLPLDVPAGVEFTTDVIFGTEENPAEDIYGVSFFIDYSSSTVNIDTIIFTPDPSWFGPEDSILYLSKLLPEEERIDIGIVRRTGSNVRTAFGKIGTLFIIIEDDIQGRPSGPENDLIMEIKGVKAINVLEEVLPVEPVTNQTTVIVGVKENIIDNLFEVYPNPARDIVSIKGIDLNKYELENIRILDVSGQVVKELKQFQNIHISDLGAGVYYIEVNTKSGVGYSKFMKH